MTVLGADVSKYQRTTPSLTGLGFLFARASIGLIGLGLHGTYLDKMYATHIANARKASLSTGAYHFGNRNLDPVAQAQAFVAFAGSVDFYFLDVEGSGSMTVAQCRAFGNEMHRLGKKWGLYHSLSGFFEAGQDYNWVAYWGGSTPPMNWTFHQYRGSPLDLDRFIGSLAQLRALSGSPLPDTSTGGDVETTVKVTEYAVPRAVTGTNVTLYLPDGQGRVIASLSSLALGEATITQSDNKAPHGSGWILLAQRPWAGWYVAAANVKVAPAPVDPTPFSEADRKAAVNLALDHVAAPAAALLTAIKEARPA